MDPKVREIFESIIISYYSNIIRNSNNEELKRFINGAGLFDEVKHQLKVNGLDSLQELLETVEIITNGTGEFPLDLEDISENEHDIHSATTTIKPTSKAKKEEEELELNFSPKELYSYLDGYVVGQDHAKKVVAIAAYNHYKRIVLRHQIQVPIQKSNILLIGPTGCGKTHIARTLARFLNVPFHIADATEFTSAGYYGKDVEVMIGELLHQCDLDVERASKGIIFIDEIDKLASRSDPGRTGADGRDIGGLGVQQALLKMLEGKKMYVPINVTQHWSKHDFVEMDTSNILFICSGAFVGLDKVFKDNKKRAGFDRSNSSIIPDLEIVDNEILKKFGMIPELLGRIPIKIVLNELSEEDLTSILTDVEDNLINEYTELFRLDGKELSFDPKALRLISKIALQRHVGARGLRTILEYVLRDQMFEGPIPKDDPPQPLRITKAMVESRLKKDQLN